MRRFVVKARNRLLGLSMLQRSIDDLGERVEHLGRTENLRFCPLCGTAGIFAPGPNGRPDAMCTACKSLERHRLTWLFLTFETDLLQRPHRLLHFAPEPSFVKRFRDVDDLVYVTADIASPLADVQVDIQALPFTDGEFDAVLCSHVLEHVPDDRRAMNELYRVVRPGGWALVGVPLKKGPTYEDPSIVTPEARREAFGQEDHVRIYGDDLEARLTEAGFAVTPEHFARRFDEPMRRHFGLVDEVLFVCRREQ